MAISANDLPSANLPAEEPQPGEASGLNRARKALESQGTGRRTAPQGAPMGQPQQVPPQGAAPVQPPPQLQQTRPIDQSINLGNLFQRAPQLQEPYRTWLRRQGARPGAGPELRALAQSIDEQRGPLDQPPKR